MKMMRREGGKRGGRWFYPAFWNYDGKKMRRERGERDEKRREEREMRREEEREGSVGGVGGEEEDPKRKKGNG